VRDPLELACTERVGAERDEILVLPKLYPVQTEPGAGSGRLGRSAPLLAAAAMEVDGIRPYREGTPAARIHWPALARGAGLMERRLRAEGDALPLVVLDPRAAGRTEDEDAAVRAAASLAHALATQAGGCSVLLPGDRRATVLDADLGAWNALHARFAVVDGARSAALALAAAGSRRGTVIYVSARIIDRFPAGAVTIARGPRLLVVPGALPGRRPAFSVAGCHGYVLGERTRRARPEATAAASAGGAR
jgi:uncharacterized protein (DUF58 family)